MKIKVSTAEGATLNWMVAKAVWPGLDQVPDGSYAPSTNAAQAYPIIDREKIGTGYDAFGKRWIAVEEGGTVVQHGHTPLIAAMRCYVVSKLGEEVDVPKELYEN